MTRVYKNSLELTADCYLNELRDRTPRLRKIIEPTGLILHSLLQPTSSPAIHKPRRIRFAHRAFQEFFLAHFLAQNQDQYRGLALPKAVVEWLHEIKVAERTH
jgi:hypothetical protein